MVERAISIRGVTVPTFIYGTAWKEDATAKHVKQAIDAGFRGIDTANQRKHYYEDGVGNALDEVFADTELSREDIFIQTKYTYQRGQDDRLPYDPEASIAEQVAQSAQRSLEHLGVKSLDSFVLHGPSQRVGIGEQDVEAWQAIQQLKADGTTSLIGVSNVSPRQLEAFLEFTDEPIDFVQNRCFARLNWDKDIRDICDKYDIKYQAFSLLTANVTALSQPAMRELAKEKNATVPQVVFRFALQLGMLPLTGTTDTEHMEQDLAVYDMELSEDDMETVRRMGVPSHLK
jgi:diketogulonate reductase-like aldo/keto reductase